MKSDRFHLLTSRNVARILDISELEAEALLSGEVEMYADELYLIAKSLDLNMDDLLLKLYAGIRISLEQAGGKMSNSKSLSSVDKSPPESL